MDAQQQVSGTQQPWISFRLGEEVYCLAIERVREVLRKETLYPVPGAPAEVLGVTNLRGEVVSVLDGHALFDCQAAPPEQSEDADDQRRIITIEGEKELFGLLVDQVVEIVPIEAEMIEPPSINSTTSNERFQVIGTYHHDSRLLIALSLMEPEESD